MSLLPISILLWEDHDLYIPMPYHEIDADERDWDIEHDFSHSNGISVG